MVRATKAVLFTAALTLSSGTAVGASPDGRPSSLPASPAGASEPRVVCGLSCIMKKEIENLSLQAMYVLKKIKALDQLSSRRETDKLRENLKEVCLSSETIEQCFGRNRRLQIRALYTIHSTIIKTKANIARLDDAFVAVRDQDGRQVPTPVVYIENMSDFVAREKGRQPQLPEFPTMQQLSERFRIDQGRLNQLVGEAYRAWQTRVPGRPAKDDFIKFRQIPRDPENPGGEKFTVVETDSDGNPVHDAAAYGRALEKWGSDIRAIEDDLRNMVASGDRPKYEGSLHPLVGDASLQAYFDARGELIAAANTVSVDGPKQRTRTAHIGVPGPTGSGGLRGVASGAAPSTYDGTESVDPGRRGGADELHVELTPEALMKEIESLAP